MMGRHSVMLSPDSVSRVTPPTMMTAMTSADESMSQFPTAGGDSTGSSAAVRGIVPLDEKKRGSSAGVVEEVPGRGLDSLTNEYCRAVATRDGQVDGAGHVGEGRKQKRWWCSPRWPEEAMLAGVFERRRKVRAKRPVEIIKSSSS